MLAVLFNSRVQTDLRQQAGSCGRRLSFRQAGGQFRLACFGPSLNRLALVLFERSIGRARRSQRRRQCVCCFERLAQDIIQRGSCNIQIGNAPDLLFHNVREMHADREHVCVGRHSSRTHCFGAFQVGFRRAHGFLGGR